MEILINGKKYSINDKEYRDLLRFRESKEKLFILKVRDIFR